MQLMFIGALHNLHEFSHFQEFSGYFWGLFIFETSEAAAAFNAKSIFDFIFRC